MRLTFIRILMIIIIINNKITIDYKIKIIIIPVIIRIKSGLLWQMLFFFFAKEGLFDEAKLGAWMHMV